MVARRPLVAVGGRVKQLPEGDTLAGVMPLAVPALLSNGTLLRLSLTPNQSLPVVSSDGLTISIPVILNG